MNNEKDNVYDLVEDFYEWKHGKAKKTVIYIVVGII